nr:MAG TPA: hypothetical protein [Caudoviricetes sp.]
MRKIKYGMNWDNYSTDTKEDAQKWYKELTGHEPCEYKISEFHGVWGFRIHK